MSLYASFFVLLKKREKKLSKEPQTTMTYFSLSVMSLVFFFSSCCAETTLILPLAHPTNKLMQSILKEPHKIEKKMKTMSIDKIAKKIFKQGLKKGMLPSLSGFPALYAGYIDYSNKDGTIQFPLRHTSHRVFIAITPEIEVEALSDNTMQALYFPASILSDAQHPNQAPEKSFFSKKAEYYALERKILDTGSMFWNIQQIPLPQNRQLKKISIILLTHPKNIVIPTGDFFIDPSHAQHYVLPKCYVVGNINQVETLIAATPILQYFEPINQTTIVTPGTVTQSIINNQ